MRKYPPLVKKILNLNGEIPDITLPPFVPLEENPFLQKCLLGAKRRLEKERKKEEKALERAGQMNMMLAFRNEDPEEKKKLKEFLKNNEEKRPRGRPKKEEPKKEEGPKIDIKELYNLLFNN